MSMASDSGEARLTRAPDPVDGTALVELGGELDLAVASDLRALLEGATADAPSRLVVDVADVTFIDSTVLREILRAHHGVAGGGGQLVVVAPQPGVRRLLQLTGTTEVFAVADSREEALA